MHASPTTVILTFLFSDSLLTTPAPAHLRSDLLSRASAQPHALAAVGLDYSCRVRVGDPYTGSYKAFELGGMDMKLFLLVALN